MNPEDFAKLNINLGFALNSIYFSKLYFYYYNVYQSKNFNIYLFIFN